MIGITVLRRTDGFKLHLRFNDKEGCIETKGFGAMECLDLYSRRIEYNNVKSVGETSSLGVAVGLKEGPEIAMELRDEADTVLLVRKIAEMSGVTAYTARY